MDVESKVSVYNNADDRELEAQGYQCAMPRKFSLLSLLSLSFALTASWNGFGSAIGTGLGEFGSAGVLWTLLIAAAMGWIVSLGMAELASAYPNSGAQYYWSFRVATPAWARFASYIPACVSTAGWWLGNASVANFIAAMILAMVKISIPDYVIHPWHQWLLYAVILWLAVAINVFGSRFVPLFSKFILYFSLTSLTATIITILVCAAPNFQKASWVFGDITDASGWDTKGLLFLLCLLNNAHGFMGTDAGAHLSGEIPNPMVNVPKAIVMPVIIGLITIYYVAWPFALACLFVIVDVERVIAPPSGLPLIEIFYQATGSKAATIVLLAAFAFCMLGCATANVAGSSRQIWAASRDNTFPGSLWWSQVSPRFQMPLNVAVLSGLVPMMYGLIFLGSSTTFASMVGANIVFMMTSYVIPQEIFVWRGRGVLPERHLNLGKWGAVVNAVACAWRIFLDVMACIPITSPKTVTNMNWASVVIVGITAYVLIAWYLWQRDVYTGPKVNVQLQNTIHHEILHHRSHEEQAAVVGVELDKSSKEYGQKSVKDYDIRTLSTLNCERIYKTGLRFITKTGTLQTLQVITRETTHLDLYLTLSFDPTALAILYTQSPSLDMGSTGAEASGPTAFIDVDTLRTRFVQAMSSMYRKEVPLYGDLIEIVRRINTHVLQSGSLSEGDVDSAAFRTDPDRLLLERHGAIRLGTPFELRTVRRMFNILGMHPVGYYDLSVAGLPMHATCFRPTEVSSLDRNAFRVFTTLLRPELLESEKTRLLSLSLLNKRNIFPDRLLDLLDTADAQGGRVTEDQAIVFLSEGLEPFSWQSVAAATLDEYQLLKSQHPILADIASFQSAHINHLTPRTLDISAVQLAMKTAGIRTKARIEGPPLRKCPILLRQTSFLALEEPVKFRQADPDAQIACNGDPILIEGSHAARFGEIEQRGAAVTRKGQALYDRLLRESMEKTAGADPQKADEITAEIFETYPDTWAELREQNLIYCEFQRQSNGDPVRHQSNRQKRPPLLQQLITDKVVEVLPVIYEDFLPFSAAGIFQSNLRAKNEGDNSSDFKQSSPDLKGFEDSLGSQVLDHYALYFRVQQRSLETLAIDLGLTVAELMETDSFNHGV
ncbi:hypothetical protein CLAIMM_01823 [Cladophialophora immunda]|nr:hypothetical protein CLAIMM_01823 [Cladophialophora immunda]